MFSFSAAERMQEWLIKTFNCLTRFNGKRFWGQLPETDPCEHLISPSFYYLFLITVLFLIMGRGVINDGLEIKFAGTKTTRHGGIDVESFDAVICTDNFRRLSRKRKYKNKGASVKVLPNQKLDGPQPALMFSSLANGAYLNFAQLHDFVPLILK